MKKKNSNTVSNSTGIRQTAMEQKRERILSGASSLFRRQGIENTSMEQISKEAQIGSATIYRYFPTKPQLVCAVAFKYWLELKERYLPLIESDDYNAQTGHEQLKRILNLFITLYEEHTDFLSFLADFDTYIKSSPLPAEQLSGYEDIIFSLKEYAQQAIQKGLADHTLHSLADTEEIYFTVFHCMLSTTQKMALSGNLLPMDSKVSGKRQLLLLTELLLQGLA